MFVLTTARTCGYDGYMDIKRIAIAALVAVLIVGGYILLTVAL
jgi:hypothetical protein